MNIDVVIPVWNGEKYISECLDSVLLQKNLGKIIVVNDGSNDSTKQIVESYLEKFKSVELHNRPHSGLSASRNFGARCANSEMLAFLDSDDLWVPEKLSQHSAHISIHPDCIFSFTLSKEFSSSPKFAISQGENIPSDNDFNSLLLQEYRIWGSGSSVVVHRRKFLDLGGFNESIKYGEDWDCWVRLAQKQFPCEISKESTLIRVHPESMQRIKRDGLDRFMPSRVHFQVWSHFPEIQLDPRFKNKAFEIMWADIRKVFLNRSFRYGDFKLYILNEYPSLASFLGISRFKSLLFILVFSRVKNRLRTFWFGSSTRREN